MQRRKTEKYMTNKIHEGKAKDKLRRKRAKVQQQKRAVALSQMGKHSQVPMSTMEKVRSVWKRICRTQKIE